jgi:hypothetical protein
MFNTDTDIFLKSQVKGKAIPVTGLGGLWACKMSRLAYFLDSQLTDGGKIVSRNALMTPS